MRHWLLSFAAVAALVLPTSLAAAAAPGPAGPSIRGLALPAAAVPAGFADTVVARIATPTGMAWTPDGRMLVTQDGGQLRVVRNGQLQANPAIDLTGRICPEGERGLLSVAVDPNFARNQFVYLFWTHDASNYCGVDGPNAPENRVTRHVLRSDDTLAPASEKVLVDHMSAQRRNHNGGDLHFGANKLLYVSVGDGGCVIDDATRCGALNTNSRRLDIPHGKILRVTRAGQVPSTNPYVDAPGARRCTLPAGVETGSGPCTETFASGLRNPFRFAQDPDSNRFFVNDVGQSDWEEIDRLRSGADYGWNRREGPCVTGSTTNCGASAYDDPVHAYSHAETGCGSVTGGAFVPDGVWPADYDGDYLFADYVCGKIFRLSPTTAGGFSRTEFMTGVSVPVHLAFGPHEDGQAMYYLDYGGGAVHQVSHSDGNTPPVASFWQRPDGRTVTLDGSDSSDPDSGDTVTSWRWDFGDGTTTSSTTPRIQHTYPADRDYRTTLRVVDRNGVVSDPFSMDVFAGEHPPAVNITAPDRTARFAVGQSVTVTAEASDPEDGALPPSALEWTVRLRYGGHFHPWDGPQSGSSITVDYPAPEDLEATENSHLVATAVATDSRGLTSRSVQKLLPRRVTLDFETSPAGGRVLVNDAVQRTPASLVSWAGYSVQVKAPDQWIGGVPHEFTSWSDGGNRWHWIITPGRTTTYTAQFVPK